MMLNVTNLEVRGIEKKLSGKTGKPYLIVRVEDDHGAWVNLIDRDISRKTLYEKGHFYNFALDLVIRMKYTSVSIIDVTLNE